MEIVETESTVILKDAQDGILKMVPDLPWKLFYYEITLSGVLFGKKLYPLDNEFKLDDLVGLINAFKEEHDDINVSVTLFFIKRME